jgi:RsiW-degrading membrane proteinase PrsW (M82 family)
MVVFVINILAIIIWTRILIKMDENRIDKNSVQTIIGFYFAGLISVVIALFLYGIFPYSQLVPNNDIVSKFIKYIFIVGPIEEFSKFIVFFIFSLKLKSIKEPRDGILQAASVALAFASIENFLYGYEYGAGVILIRSVLTIAGHMVYASIWGFYFSMIIYSSKSKKGKNDFLPIFLALILSAVIHGLYDFFLMIGMAPLALLLKIITLGIAISLYKTLVRKSPFRKFPLKEYKKAIRVITLGLKSHPESLILNQRISLLYIRAGDYELSLGYLNKCIKLKPYNSYLKCLKGIVLILNGKMKKGKEKLNQHLKKIKPAKKKLLKYNINLVIKNLENKKYLLALI